MVSNFGYKLTYSCSPTNFKEPYFDNNVSDFGLFTKQQTVILYTLYLNKNGVSSPHFYLLKIHVTYSVVKVLVGNDVRANL